MKKMLHVGCGASHKDRTTPGFNTPEWEEVRFDIDPNAEPDIIGTIVDMKNVETESVDAVYSAHNIEHIYAHEVIPALKEFYRVLRPDGYVLITCPDLQPVCKAVAEDRLLEPLGESEMGPITPLDILYGHRASIAAGNHYMAHKTGFTNRVLAMALHTAGFQGCYGGPRAGAFDLWMIAYKEPHDEPYYKEEFLKHFA